MTALIRTTKRRRSNGSLSERAYFLVRDAILKGEFSLGTVLSRRKLAEKFGMSFLPMSEALQRLENDGLVESRPRIGTRVRVPTLQDIRESYIIREALESQSARLFAEKASSQERLELLKMAEFLDSLYARSDSEKPDPNYWFSVHTYHLNLHMRIAECTGCVALREAIERNQVLIFNWLYDTASGGNILPPRFHVKLIEEISKRSPEVADAAMREHIHYGIRRTLERIEPRLDPGKWRLSRKDQDQLEESETAIKSYARHSRRLQTQ